MSHRMSRLGLLFSFYSIVALGTSLDTDIVMTSTGPVRGKILETVQSKVPYALFNSIPYAKPPLGYLRFKPPVEIEPWNKTVEATLHPKGCPQYTGGRYFGDEDCLYLNVYSPMKAFNTSDELRVVMVWIHGGGFIEGVANNSYYGPDFLLDEDVVLAYIEYRQGALGFLSLNHPNATGNAGLKDQVLAMKWIKENIRNFGGDPDRITLLGESAGAVSVELHGISEMSKGLFNRSIAMSGSPLDYWGLTSTDVAEDRAFTLIFALTGDITDDKDFALKVLYESSAEEIVMGTMKIRLMQADLPFNPTIENSAVSPDPFLSECAFTAYNNGEFLPHILGFLGSEFLAFVPTELFDYPSAASEALLEKSIDQLREAQDKLNNQSGVVANFLKHYDELREAIMETELENDEIVADLRNDLIDEFVRIGTDFFFILGIDQTQQYRSKGSAPVWYYRNTFNYNDSLHKVKGIPLNGSGHGDDLAQIFWMENLHQSLDPKSAISIQRRRMTRMWTNFAKYADPTPNGTADPLLNITWNPSGSEGVALEISRNYKMGPRPIDDMVELAETLGYPYERAADGCSIF